MQRSSCEFAILETGKVSGNLPNLHLESWRIPLLSSDISCQKNMRGGEAVWGMAKGSGGTISSGAWQSWDTKQEGSPIWKGRASHEHGGTGRRRVRGASLWAEHSSASSWGQYSELQSTTLFLPTNSATEWIWAVVFFGGLNTWSSLWLRYEESTVRAQAPLVCVLCGFWTLF